MHRSSRVSRVRVAVLTAAATLLATALGGLPAAAPASADDPTDKFTAGVEKALTSHKTADFWVRFGDTADLSAASRIKDWDQRGLAVYDTLRKTARTSQADVVKTLTTANVDFEPYWITNAILVHGGDLSLATSLASSSEVQQIRETTTYPLEKPVKMTPDTSTGMGTHQVEWGIAAINADDVWAEGITGSGITVASIDTGVDIDHPALRSKYRGLQPDGSLDNDYNFFDSSDSCGPAGDPCDVDGHGSHTMGTMLGSDGSNQIGVAPDAHWIEANGCATCADADLISSGQWMLAPTRVDGSDPDPTKRPNIINNSWGSRTPSNDPFMEDVIAAWEAAGIWGQWSNGNSGPACATSGSPGSRTLTYSSGAFDSSGRIASFSGRGSGQDGTIKPNISAPGVAVRSSLPGGGYGLGDGTSMASPHVAGAVALLWSAAPTLVGDIAGTRALLDETATDVSDLTCGGTADDNNVWGEGKLDALALVEAAPTDGAGHLTGTVTSGGNPISGASVAIAGPTNRTVTTGEDGTYDVVVSAGDYTVTVTAFGYLTGTQSATVPDQGTATLDFALEAAPTHTVSGTVTMADDGSPVAGAAVVLSAPLPAATTAADGTFTIPDVPEGSYTLRVLAGSCVEPFSTDLVVDGNESVPIGLDQKFDDYGYYCTVGDAGLATGTTKLSLTGDDAAAAVPLPFSFPFYGQTYTTAYLATNGHVNFLASNTAYANGHLPNAATPNAAIYPFWDDLNVDASAGVYTASTTVAGEQAFVIEYRNVRLYSDADARTSFSVTLLKGGGVILGYGAQTDGKPELTGTSATIGIENAAGTIGSEYSYNAEAVHPGMSIAYDLPPQGTVTGTVTDFNDGLPIADVTVTATPDDGGPAKTVKTAADGSYSLLLFLGDYTVTVAPPNYVAKSKAVSLTTDGQVVRFSPALKTGIATIDPTSFEWLVDNNDQRTATFTITNTGSAPLDVSLAEINRSSTGQVGAPALSAGNAADGFTANDAAQLTGQAAGSVAEAQKGIAALESAAAAVDENARSAKGLYSSAQKSIQRSITPDAVGDVLASWATNTNVPWGVGVDGDVWISDAELVKNIRYTPTGGRVAEHPATWGGTWSGDLAYDSLLGEMCQVNVGGDNGIVCFSESTGAKTRVLTGSGWSGVSQRGLAYNPTDDVFYIGGWNEGIIYTVAGTSHANPGATLAQCQPAEGGIAGLGYNPTSGTIWMVPSVESNTMFYQLSPADCSTLRTVAFPGTGDFPGSGMEVDESGNIWAADQVDGKAYLVDVGDPRVSDVPWLTESPTTARIAVGKSKTFTVNVNSALTTPGVHVGNIAVSTGAGRIGSVSIPVTLVVSAYSVGVDAGGTAAFRGSDLFDWSADQKYQAGSWGWSGQRADVETTTHAIGGTVDDPIFQSRRTGAFTYTFDNVPAGTYAIDLGFAEFKATPRERTRVFDVLVDGAYQLIEEDPAADVGGFYADQHQLVVEHTGGPLTVELRNRRSYDYPILNALKVQERPDL